MLLLALPVMAQKKPVSGSFIYKATIALPDTNVIIKQWEVRLFTNDTIVRLETQTDQVGDQVYIRHMELNKAYLLLSFDGANYAIQTDLEENRVKDTVPPRYTITKKHGSKKIAGIKCKKYYILDNGQTEGNYGWFAKKISNKYLEVYPEIPGLAVDYYLPTQDGLVRYELISYTPGPVNRDMFGIPSDYKKITFDEFVNMFANER